MTSLSITQQDKKLLDWIAIGESGGSYTAVHPGSQRSDLTSMSLAQILYYQEYDLEPGPSSGAVGRYQFVRPTLSDTIAYANMPTTTTFSPGVQDYLIVQRLLAIRKYTAWKSEGITDEAFMINLAKEFASTPVPRDMQGHFIFVKEGQSYYLGVQDNTASDKYTVSSYLQVLADIRTGGTGSTITFEPTTSTSPGGFLPMTQAEVAAGGGQRLKGGSGKSYASELPAASDPYFYVPIAAENNRYDFRTGKKVTDILVNGTNPASNAGLTTNNGRPPVADAGREDYTAEQKTALTKNRISVGYGTNKIDPALARAVGLKFDNGTQLSTTVSGATSAGSKSLPVAKSNAQ